MPPQASAAAVAQAPASTTVPLTADLAALTKQARALGFEPRGHNGTIIFCRTSPQIGSRLESTSCISQADVASVSRGSTDSKAGLETLQRKSLNVPTSN